jgi:hypothetical protein
MGADGKLNGTKLTKLGLGITARVANAKPNFLCHIFPDLYQFQLWS